ncbi:MAG: cytochrome ubiquinol oxidase subunit I [Candidatus Binatia bacterium]
MDVLTLSRIQFALTIMFHYLFPPLTIGLGVVLVYLDGMSVRTGRAVYAQAARFWTSIFALNFAIGVATGIVMEFEFGTNWAAYSRFVGDVFGSALAAEGIFAFFLESGFLAILVFGWDRVGARMHFFSTCMVALGSIFSSIWIVVANSWQQTPAGHHIVPVMRDGVPWVVAGVPVTRAEIVDFWAMVFNPSSVERLVHVLLGCFIMGAFFVMSISAWYILRSRHREFAERSFRGALFLATGASLAILVSGHSQARTVAHTQPAKLAAFEGHYETGPAALSFVGWPEPKRQRLGFQLAIPGLLSFLIHGDSKASVTGLDRFRSEDRPPVRVSYLSYHLMVLLGLSFLGLTVLACFFLWNGTLFRQRWLMWVFVFAVIGAVAANQSGWVAAEVGRQPWIVYPPVPYRNGQLVLGDDGRVQYDAALGLRTSEAVSRAISANQVAGSIAMFGLIYLLLLSIWVFVLRDKIRKGPEPVPGEAHEGEDRGVLAAAGARIAHRASLTPVERRGDGS